MVTPLSGSLSPFQAAYKPATMQSPSAQMQPASQYVPTPASGASDETDSLRLVYSNDPHKKLNRFPRMVTAYRELSQQAEAKGQDVLRVNTGDVNIGFNGKEWQLSVLMEDLMRLHAATMGNHELDQGLSNYTRGLRWASFPTLVSNLQIPAASPLAPLEQQGRILTHATIIKGQNADYGLIGVTTPDLAAITSKKVALDGLTSGDFERTVAKVQQEIDMLEAQGINRIVLLSHMGFEFDAKMAQRMNGIDVIVGGHSHTLLTGNSMGKNLFFSPEGDPVLVLQAGSNAQWIGAADVRFDPWGHIVGVKNELLPIQGFGEDPKAKQLLAAFMGLSVPVCYVDNRYDNQDVPYKENPIANFAADSVRAYTKSDVALVLSSQIRDDLMPGVMTNHDIKMLMPFNKDVVVTINATGQEIKSILQRSAVGVQKHDSHPGLLHPSGLVYGIDEDEARITRVFVQDSQTGTWERLREDKTYTVSLVDYSVRNPKHFPEIAQPQRIIHDTGLPLGAIFQWGLQNQGGLFKPLHFSTDGRLRIE